jgi:tetratricopeptide (TPR) repeat protein
MFTRIAAPLLLLVLLVFCSSCGPQITEQGKRQLRSSAELIRNGSYSVAADELDKFLEAYPGSDEVGEAYYMIGLCRVRISQLDRAEDAFKSALAVADVPILERYVRLSLANLAFERRDYSSAGESYGSCFDDLPRREPFHLAYYRYGLALQALGKWKQADVQFAHIMRCFPETDILPWAREHFGWTSYAIELGRFASLDLASQQRREFADLSPQVRWHAHRGPNGWEYVNYYGEFSDFERAKDALAAINHRLSQARIVP